MSTTGTLDAITSSRFVNTAAPIFALVQSLIELQEIGRITAPDGPPQGVRHAQIPVPQIYIWRI